MALLVYYDNGVEYSYVVGPEPVVVGRANECAIRTVDGRVSRNHARFFLDQAGTLYVEDLGSSNGVYVGSQKVQQSPVRLNELVGIGGLTFRLVSHGAIAAQMPPPNPSWQPVDTQPAAYGATQAYQPYGDPYGQQVPGAAPYQPASPYQTQPQVGAPYQPVPTQPPGAPYQPVGAPYQPVPTQPPGAPYQPPGAPYQPYQQVPAAQPPPQAPPAQDMSSSVQIDWNADVDVEKKARLSAEASVDLERKARLTAEENVDVERKARLTAEANVDLERNGRMAAQSERDAAEAKVAELNETIRRLVEDLAATKMELESAKTELGKKK